MPIFCILIAGACRVRSAYNARRALNWIGWISHTSQDASASRRSRI
jgi:hypothetical protein